VVNELSAPSPYRQVRADFASYEADLQAPLEDFAFDRQRFLAALRRYLSHHSLDVDWETAQAAPEEALINSLSMALPFDPAEKQALLEAADLSGRRETLTALLEIDAAENSDEPPSLQ
jgi:Lon protease-like protein